MKALPLPVLSLQVFRQMVLLVLLFNSPIFAANIISAAPVSIAKVKVTMRNHGYTIGDLIVMRTEFTLKKGQAFDPDSVPLRGPVNNWLDLRDVAMTESKDSDGSSKIAIDFTWQIFGTVEHAQLLKIPGIALQTLVPNTTNAKPLFIIIPAQSFNMSPVLPQTLEGYSPRRHMPPFRFDTSTPLVLAITCLSLALLSGLLYLWLLDKLAWWPRNPGPITKLARLFKHQKVAQQPRFTLNDLRNIHAALASSAGQSLYPNTLSILFENCPYLTSNKAAITQFYNTSWSLFYDKSSTSSVTPIFVPDTIAWIKRAAIAERFARSQVQKETKNHRITQQNKLAKL
jgi:hypothetical protein